MSNKNREILLQGSANIEQFDENDNPMPEITIYIDNYPEVVDEVLAMAEKEKGEISQEDVLNQLVDKLSDATGNCVLSYSIDEELLSFS